MVTFGHYLLSLSLTSSTIAPRPTRTAAVAGLTSVDRWWKGSAGVNASVTATWINDWAGARGIENDTTSEAVDTPEVAAEEQANGQHSATEEKDGCYVDPNQ